MTICWPKLVINSKTKYTLQLALANFSGEVFRRLEQSSGNVRYFHDSGSGCVSDTAEIYYRWYDSGRSKRLRKMRMRLL